MGCLFSSPAEDKNVANFDDVRKPKEQGIPPPKIEQDQNKFEPFTPPSGHQSRSTSPPEHRQTLEESTAKTEELWVKYRSVVEQHAQKMHELFDAASAAHKAGNGAQAKALSEQGHNEQAAMKKAQALAANAIFAAKNKDQPPGTIDLHGLLVNEALHIVDEQLRLAKSSQMAALRIIVGAGHHSGPGGPKIRPAVEQWLSSKNYRWHEDADNASHGSLTVEVK
jgi:DNA-nicking Smr family endonuclease